MDLIFCISGLQIFIVLAQKLLLGRRGENPEVGPELLGSVLPWEHVADLPWDPGSRFSSSSVPFRNFFFFPFKQGLLSGCRDTLGTFSGEGEMHLH